MADFKVQTTVLRSQADQLETLNGQFKTCIEQLVTSEGSLNSMWDGDANDAFHNAFVTDKGKMDEFYKLIIQYIERLRSIATKYEQAEQANLDIASTRSY